jgi:hypothetical protein
MPQPSSDNSVLGALAPEEALRLRRRGRVPEGATTPYDAEEYQNAFSRIVHASLAVFETILVAYVGPQVYRDATERFLKQATGPGSEAVQERSAVILS